MCNQELVCAIRSWHVCQELVCVPGVGMCARSWYVCQELVCVPGGKGGRDGWEGASIWSFMISTAEVCRIQLICQSLSNKDVDADREADAER